jgi:hypothetical protein
MDAAHRWTVLRPGIPLIHGTKWCTNVHGGWAASTWVHTPCTDGPRIPDVIGSCAQNRCCGRICSDGSPLGDRPEMPSTVEAFIGCLGTVWWQRCDLRGDSRRDSVLI